MALIKGIEVILYDEIEIGTDELGQPLTEVEEVAVQNVLVYPAEYEAMTSSTTLDTTKTTYRICIPKSDTHEWRNRTVEFFGKKWKTYTDEIQYIEEMVPMDWNRKILCELYE